MVYYQPLFDFNKDLVTKDSHFHDHISGDAMSSSICFLAIKEKIFIFSIFPPSVFSNKTGKQSLIVISLNICSTTNSLSLFYSKYHLPTCKIVTHHCKVGNKIRE